MQRAMSDEHEGTAGWLTDEDDAPVAAAPETNDPPAKPAHVQGDESCACEMCGRINALCDDLADVTLLEKHKAVPIAFKIEALARVIVAINTEKSIPGQESHNGLSIVESLARQLVTHAERKQQQMVQRIMSRIAENGGTLPIEISRDLLLQGGVFTPGHDDGDPES